MTKLVKYALFSLLACAVFTTGHALECYHCENCGNDVSKATRESCSDSSQCVTYASMSSNGVNMEGRGCAPSGTTCSELIASRKPQAMENSAALSTACTFCPSDLCNGNGISNINSNSNSNVWPQMNFAPLLRAPVFLTTILLILLRLC